MLHTYSVCFFKLLQISKKFSNIFILKSPRIYGPTLFKPVVEGSPVDDYYIHYRLIAYAFSLPGILSAQIYFNLNVIYPRQSDDTLG